jgi:serine/threonine-protein kinase RsbW
MGSEMSSRTVRGSAREGSPTHRARRGLRSRPPLHAGDVRLSLPARAENVAVVRHVLGAFAEALRLPPELVEDIRLAATEACTNVVRHAYRDGEDGPIDVTIRPDGDRLVLVVSDRGQGLGPSADLSGPGLGLPLIAALADSVDLQELPVRGSRIAMSFRCRPRLGLV